MTIQCLASHLHARVRLCTRAKSWSLQVRVIGRGGCQPALPRTDSHHGAQVLLLELESFPSLASLQRHRIDKEELGRARWLHDGMLASEVDELLSARTDQRKRASVTREDYDALREKRRKEDKLARGLQHTKYHVQFDFHVPRVAQ